MSMRGYVSSPVYMVAVHLAAGLPLPGGFVVGRGCYSRTEVLLSYILDRYTAVQYNVDTVR